ncbi:MAG: LysR family transcriptional regulator [Pseudomonadota bacterium]
MARFKLEHLRTMQTVARLRSVSRAAEVLHLTQPAVTSRIKALEDAVGAPIFERASGGMRPTKRGDLLLQYAEQFQYLSDLVEENVVDAAGMDRLMRLGVSETVAQSWLPEFVGALYSRFPQLKIELSVDISINLRQQLLGNEIDLAVLLGPVSDYTVNNVVLPEVPLGWFKAADTDPDAAVDFSAVPIATYAKNTRPYRELRSTLFERYGPDVSLFPSSSLSSCFRMVEAGMCVGALPLAMGEKLVAEGKLRLFDPGWTPKPLSFSASYLADPRSHLLASAAEIAQATAVAYG